MKLNFILLFFIAIVLASCSKYSNNNSSSTTSGNQTGYTPIGAGLSGSGSSGSGSGGGTSSGGGSTGTVDTVDGVYVQGIYINDPNKALTAKSVSTGVATSMWTQGHYTKLSQGAYSFYDPTLSSGTKYLGQTNFTANSYYTIISNAINPDLVVLDNGKDVNPSSSKAYVRFINICDTAQNVSVNVKISTSNDEAYFSYRKPFDFYAVGNHGIWYSIYNQMYNSAYTNYTSVNPGVYKGEIYLSNNVALTPQPTYNFIGGKKYTILVRQYYDDVKKVTVYNNTLIVHN